MLEKGLWALGSHQVKCGDDKRVLTFVESLTCADTELGVLLTLFHLILFNEVRYIIICFSFKEGVQKEEVVGAEQKF